MALSVRYRANRPLMGIGAGLIAFVLALGVVATTGYLNPHEQRNAALVRVAERVVTLELNLGAPSTGHALSFDSAYQPFRYWLVPGTQAPDFTKWVLAQDLASAHAAPGLRLTRSHWWTRRVALIEPNHRYTTVVLSVYWWKKFRPSGESTGTEALLETVRGLRDGGAHGSIIGRNSFQRPKEEALALLGKVIEIYQGRA